jgi:histidyl-tRNA synthetase
VRLWYLSSFFRYERAQAGRYRQFWQIGAEAIGSDDPALDAEAILLLADVLAEVGCRGVELRISSLGTPATRAQYRELLKDYLREHEAQLAPEVVARIELNPLRAFDAQDEGTRAVMAEAPRLLDHLTPEDAARFGAVCALLDDAGVAYELDPTLVRGLDYYTHTVFEFASTELGAQSGVGGGGRYDGLIEQLGGPATAAIGWAAGIERMLLAAGDQPSDPPAVDLFVAHEREEDAARAFALARDARRAGLAAQNEVAGRSLKGQLKQAERVGARFVAVLGAEGARLRERGAGEEQIEAERVVARLLERRHT